MYNYEEIKEKINNMEVNTKDYICSDDKLYMIIKENNSIGVKVFEITDNITSYGIKNRNISVQDLKDILE